MPGQTGDAPLGGNSPGSRRIREFTVAGESTRPTDDVWTNAALPVTQAAAGSVTRDVVAKVATAISQLPSVVADMAQQARTASSPRRVVIPLDPPALGHVTVEIIVRADSVRVSLQHADESTFNALNAQRPAIEAALESSGLHLTGFDVSSQQRQQQAARSQTASTHFETLTEQVEPDGALRL
jgi:flagellar hook-length control protein FliK